WRSSKAGCGCGRNHPRDRRPRVRHPRALRASRPGGEEEKGWFLTADRLHLRVYEEALEILARSLHWPIRIRADGIHLKIEASSIPFDPRVIVKPAPDGHLRAELVGIKAASFLPLPASLASGFLQEKLRGRSGVVQISDNVLDFDLAALLRRYG